MHDSCLLRGRVATYWLTWFSFEACITSYAASVTIEHLRRIDIEDKTVPVPSVRTHCEALVSTKIAKEPHKN